MECRDTTTQITVHTLTHRDRQSDTRATRLLYLRLYKAYIFTCLTRVCLIKARLCRTSPTRRAVVGPAGALLLHHATGAYWHSSQLARGARPCVDQARLAAPARSGGGRAGRPPLRLLAGCATKRQSAGPPSLTSNADVRARHNLGRSKRGLPSGPRPRPCTPLAR